MTAATGPAGLRAAASGPGRLRAALRRQSGPLRRFSSATDAAARVGTVVPAELFGAQLLDVLGERLRGLLQEAPGEAEAALRRPSETAWPERNPAQARHWPGGPPAVGPMRDGLTPAAVGPPNGAGEAVEASGPPGWPAAQRTASAVPALPSPVARAAGVARLAEQVRRYWQGAEAAAPPDRMIGGAPESRRAEPGRLRSMPPAAAEGSPRPWPRLDEQDIARRLHAFADGRPAPTTDLASAASGAATGEGRADWPAGGPDGQAWSHWEGGLEAAPGPRPRPEWLAPATPDGWRDPEALRTLSDDVAEILRDQSLRHGIDIS